MLFIKKKIKICIVPGYKEEWLIGYRFELLNEIITRYVIPFEFMWKWNPTAVLYSSLWRGLWSWVAICWCARGWGQEL